MPNCNHYRKTATVSLLIVVSLACCGCGHWAPSPAKSLELPKPKMSADSVVLEIASIKLPFDSASNLELWSAADEQILPNEIRAKLAQNGFRIGVLSGELPSTLHSVLKQPTSNRIGDVDPESSRGFVVSQQRMQNRTGRRGKVVTSDIRDEIVSLMPNEGRITGRTLFLAQSLFSLRTYPRGDGQVRLELVPEIEHGQPKTRYVGQPNEGAFRLDTGRERAIFNELKLDPILAPGQTLMLSCTDDWKGLGRQFFAESTGDVKMQRVLLIRLSQTQADDRFSSQQFNEKELDSDGES